MFYGKEFSNDKTLLTLIAYVGVIEGSAADAQVQDAQGLLEKYDKDETIPASMNGELKAILESNPRKKRKKANAWRLGKTDDFQYVVYVVTHFGSDRLNT